MMRLGGDKAPARKSRSLANSSSIETASGTLHVQPYHPSKDSSRLHAKLTFVPRTSHFESYGADPFRGFYVLFWIAIFLFMLRTYVTSFDQTGYPLSLSFATLFSKDALSLALSDGALVGSTGLAVVLVKLIKNGWIRYYWTGVILQHTYQAITLGIAVKWTFDRRWEWVQSGFFTLHCLVMLMKVHSYIAVNGNLSELKRRHREASQVLDSIASKLPGGRDQAEKDAYAIRAEKEKFQSSTHTTDGSATPEGVTMQNAEGAQNLGSVDLQCGGLLAETLRNRLQAIPASNLEVPTVTTAVVASSTPEPGTPQPQGTSYFPISTREPVNALVDHPDPQIDTLARTVNELAQALRGKTKVQWPQNVTLRNFMDYQLIPTLVYELEYPRTDRIRPFYVFEKTVAFLGTFTLLYTIAEHYIIPLTPRPGQPFFRSLLDLALPFMLSYLLLFYIIFECICNGFAELSRFADREFYEDWWNSTSFDEFSRKWNKPVHSFLLRHVYASSISYHRLSKPNAAMVTFLLSALIHELVMAVVTKKIRMYLFLMQMAQIPMITLGRLPLIKKNRVLGNVVFWISLMTGFPLLCVAYCAY